MGEWIDGWVGEKMGEQADERIDGYISLVENAHHYKAMEVEKNFRFQVGGIDHWARRASQTRWGSNQIHRKKNKN